MVKGHAINSGDMIHISNMTCRLKDKKWDCDIWLPDLERVEESFQRLVISSENVVVNGDEVQIGGTVERGFVTLDIREKSKITDVFGGNERTAYVKAFKSRPKSIAAEE